MLEELAKSDSQWRKIATKICGCSYTADDIVNEMYLKLHKLQPEKSNVSYVSYCMYHIFLNQTKQNKKTVLLDDFSWIERQVDDQTTEQRKKIDNILNELHIFDREILLLTHEMSLRQVADELNSFCDDTQISYGKVNYQKKNALKKLLETNGIKTLLKNGL